MAGESILSSSYYNLRNYGCRKIMSKNNDTYLLLMYNTCNTPATPLNNAHPGGFFLFIKRFKYEICQTPYNISRTG